MTLYRVSLGRRLLGASGETAGGTGRRSLCSGFSDPPLVA